MQRQQNYLHIKQHTHKYGASPAGPQGGTISDHLDHPHHLGNAQQAWQHSIPWFKFGMNQLEQEMAGCAGVHVYAQDCIHT